MRNSRAIWLLLLANSISGVAQGISMLAIPWYFTAVIHSETLYGEIFFVITCISLPWGMYSGTLIDRYNRKHLFLAINVVGLLVLASAAALGFANGSLPWLLVALVFAATTFIYNVHFPNLYAFAQEITEKKDYGRVTSLLEIQGQFTFALAGGLAAILLNGVEHSVHLFGMSVTLPFSIHPWKIYEVFALDGTTYLIALFIIYRIKSLPVVEKERDFSSLKERLKTGIRFLHSQPLIFLFGTGSLMVFLTIIVSSMYVLPVYVHSFLDKAGDVFALGDMSFSLGALAAGFLTHRLLGNKGAVLSVILLSLVAGLMYGLMAMNKILVLFYLAQFIIGMCNSAIRVQRVTYLFHHIPNRIIGRTNSIFFMSNVFLRMCFIGLFTLPYFHDGTQIKSAMIIMALVCWGAAIILSMSYRKLTVLPVRD